MCSDLAIRSGTAVRLGPSNYVNGELSFRTKYGAIQRVGVTHELALLLDQCKKPDVPFVAQLPRGTCGMRGGGTRPIPVNGKMSLKRMHEVWNVALRAAGILRTLHPHDLRRTTARRVYSITHDLRDVQHVLGHHGLASTVWYLQDEIARVPASTLELAKLDPTTETVQ
jgi:integrase